MSELQVLNNAILPPAMKVYLETLGCKLNESELEAWTRKFAAEGHQVVASAADADLCVLNTCTVTSNAARKSRNRARQLARANPNARLVLTGCYASTEPSQARALPNVARVVPNADKDNLVPMAVGILPTADCAAEAASQQPSTAPAAPGIRPPRTRAFVKIQDGCNMSCTYCIIPRARGKERSRPLNEIVSEIQSLVDTGYKEIILTGVQISDYRSEKPVFLSSETTGFYGLRDLVAALLAETKVPRLRLTSIAPWDLDPSLLDLFSDARLCRHLHLSLQSGSDTVLRRMRRPYTTAQFARIAELAREKIPDVGITTDVIVGFPGETELEFEQSLLFVARMRFARVHVFSYSARTGTIAAGLPSHLSDAAKANRAKRMQGVADTAAGEFASRLVGRALEVLWENAEPTEDGGGRTNDSPRSPIQHWSGYTDNYVRVVTHRNEDLHNRIERVWLSRVEKDALIGSVERIAPEMMVR